jgi:endoglucanase
MRSLVILVLVIGCGNDGGGAVDGSASDSQSSGDASGADAGGADATRADAGDLGIWYAGVNLAGAEFGDANLPGTYGIDYTYPTAAEVDYFLAKGMTILRVPFRWERLQQSLGAPLDPTELARLDTFVSYATGAGMTVIIDPHNYARYHGDLIGSAAVSRAAFADFWSRIAAAYATNPRVVFGIVNEPHTMATEDWLAAANDAIAAIRSAGAQNLVLVPGNAWTGAHSWLQSWYGTPNATVMLGVVDPGNNFAFEVHQYLDADFSGTSQTCVSTTIGTESIAEFTEWLRTHGHRGFLGEFGAAANPTCQTAIDNLLDTLDASRDAWIGWSWWAAGPWWSNYMYSIEPGPGDKPQMAWLEEHL